RPTSPTCGPWPCPCCAIAWCAITRRRPKGSRWTASWRGSFRSGHVRRGGGAVVHRALAFGSIRMCPVIRHLVPGLFLSTAFPAAAQLPIVDIAAVPVGGQVEVRVRPDAGFNGLFSSIVFTLKWPEADGA